MACDRSPLIVLNRRQEFPARAQLWFVIEDVRNTGLPRARDETLCEQQCSARFERISENAPGIATGLFAGAS